MDIAIETDKRARDTVISCNLPILCSIKDFYLSITNFKVGTEMCVTICEFKCKFAINFFLYIHRFSTLLPLFVYWFSEEFERLFNHVFYGHILRRKTFLSAPLTSLFLRLSIIGFKMRIMIPYSIDMSLSLAGQCWLEDGWIEVNMLVP